MGEPNLVPHQLYSPPQRPRNRVSLSSTLSMTLFLLEMGKGLEFHLNIVIFPHSMPLNLLDTLFLKIIGPLEDPTNRGRIPVAHT